MKFLADGNFPGPALETLRNTGWDVRSVAEECPGSSDEEVAALCADEQRILLTFHKDFGDLVFRITPESPDHAADLALELVESRDDLRGCFCVLTKDRIRVRRLEACPGI